MTIPDKPTSKSQMYYKILKKSPKGLMKQMYVFI